MPATPDRDDDALRLYRDPAMLWFARLFCLGIAVAGFVMRSKSPGLAVLFGIGGGVATVAAFLSGRGGKPRIVVDANGIHDEWLGREALSWQRIRGLGFANQRLYVHLADTASLGLVRRTQVRAPRGRGTAQRGVELPLGGLRLSADGAWRRIAEAARRFGPEGLSIEGEEPAQVRPTGRRRPGVDA